ncbi:MAG: D-glycero-beta-D-manno-heptose 1,7-bisphosphate 7-phosphatase [Chloroflexota bacterium]
MSHPALPRPAVFLDRDGVLNYNPEFYVKSWDEFRFLPGVLEALSALAACPWPIVVITNQSVVGRGIISAQALDEIHARMQQAIAAAGGRLDGVYVCTHHPAQACTCRKPAPGLLLQAAAELNLDLSASVFIGDSPGDVQAALAAGVLPVLVRQNQEKPLALEAPGMASGTAGSPGPLVGSDLPAVVDSLQRVCALAKPPADVIYYWPDWQHF